MCGEYYSPHKKIKLQEGEFFISSFDLNIEQGQIEEPRKPMIRFGPLSRDTLEIALLNYLCEEILSDIEQLKKTFQ